MSAPIIPWLGGKRRLADRLIPLFPPHECYVEVFCGGAALYFLRPTPAPVEIINDINGDLISLYRIVQHHLVEFVRQFQWALTSRQLFEWLRMTHDGVGYPVFGPGGRRVEAQPRARRHELRCVWRRVVWRSGE